MGGELSQEVIDDILAALDKPLDSPTVDVLGTQYGFYSNDDGERMVYADTEEKKLVVQGSNDYATDLRMAILYAYVYESGLKSLVFNDTLQWFAIQAPKIIQTFKECGV